MLISAAARFARWTSDIVGGRHTWRLRPSFVKTMSSRCCSVQFQPACQNPTCDVMELRNYRLDAAGRCDCRRTEGSTADFSA